MVRNYRHLRPFWQIVVNSFQIIIFADGSQQRDKYRALRDSCE